MHVLKGVMVVMKGVRDHSLYYLDVEAVVCESEINVQYYLNLWHKRLGHVGEIGLHELIKQWILKDNVSTTLDDCEYCILGKNKKQSYGNNSYISSAPLDYAYSNLWGPYGTETVGGGRYFMSILDDHSRKLWV